MACFRTYKNLAPGERVVVPIIAADRAQAKVSFRYVTGFVHNIPMLKRMVTGESKESIEFSNKLTNFNNKLPVTEMSGQKTV